MQEFQSRAQDFKRRSASAKASFLASIGSPERTQTIVLSDLAEITRDATHWRSLHADLSSLGAFRRTVPISAYTDFDAPITKEVITKGGILSNSPVTRWLKTSGTTGKPKLVPYTLHWMRNYRVPAMLAMWDTFISACPQIVLHENSILDTQTVREVVRPTIYGLPHQSISNRHPKIDDSDWNPPWNDAPWYDPSVPADHNGRSYVRLRYFLGRDLRAITAINPSMILSLRDKLEEYAEPLIRDVRNGTLDGKKRRNIAPEPDYARHLEQQLARPGFVLKDIWPKLGFFSCWSSAGAAGYFNRLYDQAPRATVVPFMTCGTEGVVTIPICPELDSQPLAINQAVFEFIPADVDPSQFLGTCEADTLAPHEVEPGKRYHLIMSQAHGLLRLWTGDMYEVTEVRARVPWLRFIERYGVFNSFTGEKLTHADIATAFERTFKELVGQGMPYLFAPKWDAVPAYVVAIESPSNTSGEKFSAYLDRQLASLNLEYAAKRESGRLAPPIVYSCPVDTLRKHFENSRNNNNGNQYKFKHHQLDSHIVEQFRGGSR